MHTIKLEYIMLLNLPIILSSNSFLFCLLFPFLSFFILIYSPPIGQYLQLQTAQIYNKHSVTLH